ncbi:MAG: type II toxin-antitoxin system VapC family toxin [Spirochaetota bacterium]
MTTPLQGGASPLLLDTRALILLLDGAEGRVGLFAQQAAEEAQAAGGLRLCDVSLFEMAQLEEQGDLVFSIPLLAWVEQALDIPGLSLERLTPEIAAEAARLPGAPSAAEGLTMIDRIIAATCRVRGLRLLAGSRALASYGDAGYLSIVSLR